MAYTNQRTAYGETLVKLGATNKNIVMLEADLGNSTQSSLFRKAYPDRHFECGIAEANMTSMAAGLAQTGKIPFTNSFAVFSAGRAFDQIRQTICIGKLNVKICGSSAGCSDFGDGATHQSVEDMAIMSSIPNMTVICPADANETVEAVKFMVDYNGPCYIRINRNDYENVTEEGKPFQLGVPTVLKEGTDVVIFGCGRMLVNAMEAAKALEGKVSVKVVNVSTIKPMNPDLIIEAAKDCKGVVTVEEHNVINGLGAAIARALCKECKPIEFMGIQDQFGSSAHSYNDILNYMGLTTENIIKAVEKVK